MNEIDILIIAVIIVVLGAAVWYIYRAKRKGIQCIGCPDAKTCGGNCSGCQCSCGRK